MPAAAVVPRFPSHLDAARLTALEISFFHPHVVFLFCSCLFSRRRRHQGLLTYKVITPSSRWVQMLCAALISCKCTVPVGPGSTACRSQASAGSHVQLFILRRVRRGCLLTASSPRPLMHPISLNPCRTCTTQTLYVCPRYLWLVLALVRIQRPHPSPVPRTHACDRAYARTRSPCLFPCSLPALFPYSCLFPVPQGASMPALVIGASDRHVLAHAQHLRCVFTIKLR